MNIETALIGYKEIMENQIYEFPKGIPGFEHENKFALIELEDSPFSYLQSLQERELAFLVTDPFLFYPDYEFELVDADASELGIESNVMIRCVVTLGSSLEQATINLLAPLVLNPDKQAGKQIVLHQSTYRTRHSLWGTDASYESNVEGGE